MEKSLSPPKSYRQAARMFRKGEISFDELLAAVAQLPPPPEPEAPATSMNERYLQAEASTITRGNDVIWLSLLELDNKIDLNQLRALLKAAAQPGAQ